MKKLLQAIIKFFPKNLRLIFVGIFLFFNLSLLLFFLVNQYWFDSKKNFQRNTETILNVIHLLKNDQLISREGKLYFLNDKSTDASITHKPLWLNQLKTTELNQIHQKITRSKDRFLRLSYEIEPSVWLNISLDRMPQTYYMVILLFAFEIFFTLLILIYFWSIQKFSSYLKQTKTVANRLGVELPLKQHPISALAVVKNAELSLDILCNKIQQLLNDRTTALAAISHDIRTPLTRIKLNLQLLEDQSRNDSINEEIDEIDYLLKELMHFAKYNSVEEEKTSFDLVSLLQAIALDMQDLGYALFFNTESDQFICSKQKVSLKRAFVNIINNAIKYGNKCYIFLKQTKNNLIIIIEDEGEGIPAEMHEKVFEPFFCCDPSRSRLHGGIGLGLTIAKTIITANEGAITLENRESKGLRVKMAFEK